MDDGESESAEIKVVEEGVIICNSEDSVG